MGQSLYFGPHRPALVSLMERGVNHSLRERTFPHRQRETQRVSARVRIGNRSFRPTERGPEAAAAALTVHTAVSVRTRSR